MSSSSKEPLLSGAGKNENAKKSKSVRFSSENDVPSKEDIEKEEQDLKRSSERFRKPKNSVSPRNSNKSAEEAVAPRVNPKRLQFQDIVAVAVKKKGIRQEILKKVSGVARPGQLTFIMGSSGAGKTTLLNILTGRNLKNMETDGEIMVNGRPMVSSEMKKLSAYVQQDDVFIGMLTVKETLKFSARMRSPKKLSSNELEDIVDDLLVMMSLKKCENTRVGSISEKSLSRGERKRLAFACEILTDPPILFCDEPTSGLDSFMSYQVIKALRKLTNEGKTVVCTIHQPSTSVFLMADSLILLSQGHVAYQGPAKEVDSFFMRCGYPVPKFVSSPDHFMKVISHKPTETEQDYDGRVMRIVEENRQMSLDSSGTSSRTASTHGESDLENMTFARTWFCQFLYCFFRALVQIVREKGLIFIKLLQTLMLAFLIGSVYLGLQIDADHLFSFKGFAFVSVQMMHLLFLMPSMTVFWKDYPVIIREYQANMYSPSAYYFAKTTADCIQYSVFPLIFGSILLFMTDLPSSTSAIGNYLAISVLLSINAASMAQAIVAIVGDLATAMTVLPIVALPLMVFGGFLISFDAIPWYFLPFSYISWYKYGFEAMVMSFFQEIDEIPGCGRNQTNSMVMECSTGKKFIKDMSIYPKSIFLDYCIIIATIVFWKCIGVLSFSRKIRKC